MVSFIKVLFIVASSLVIWNILYDSVGLRDKVLFYLWVFTIHVVLHGIEFKAGTVAITHVRDVNVDNVKDFSGVY